MRRKPPKQLRSHVRRSSRLVRSNGRRGATVVEMAIVAPVFFILIFGMIEFSRVMMVRQALTDSARVGCRTAILATTKDVQRAEDASRDYMRPFMSSANDQSACRVTFSPADLSDVERGTEITASVEVNCPDVSWIFLGYMQNETLRSEARMQRE